MIRVVTTHESNRIKSVVTDCEKLLQKVVSCSTFCNKICTCCTFYRPMADLLCNKRPTLVTDLSPAKLIQYEVSIYTTCNNLICCKTGLNGVTNMHFTAFQLFLK